MVVMLAIDFESDGDFGVDAGAAVTFKIEADGKGEAIDSVACIRAEIAAPSVAVRGTDAHCNPGIAEDFIEANRKLGGGLAQDRIEHMGGDCAHCRSHFLNRSWVIWRCCSAASRSSLRRSLANRLRKMLSISSADFPVAHTM